MIIKPKQSLRVVSINVNGLRAATNKGFIDWLSQNTNIDIVCMQETRILPHQVTAAHLPEGFYTHLFPAVKPGYSGTAIYSRIPWTKVEDSTHFELATTEGRLTAAHYELNTPSGILPVVVASAYFPSGSSSDISQVKKDSFLEQIYPVMQQWKQENKSVILCGDMNIAHKEIDLKNWRANQNNSGFLPHERQWLDKTIEQLGYIDAFRAVNNQPEEYSWWSNRGQAWANNVGWRIDYQLVSADWQNKIANAFIYKDQRFSDHAPVVIDYTL